jgi:hypothetical protein
MSLREEEREREDAPWRDGRINSSSQDRNRWKDLSLAVDDGDDDDDDDESHLQRDALLICKGVIVSSEIATALLLKYASETLYYHEMLIILYKQFEVIFWKGKVDVHRD